MDKKKTFKSNKVKVKINPSDDQQTGKIWDGGRRWSLKIIMCFRSMTSSQMRGIIVCI